MLIGKNYKLEVQGMDIVLQEKYTGKKRETGETYDGWKDIGFYSSLGGAMTALINKHVKETQLTDLRTILKAIEDLKKAVQYPPELLQQSRDRPEG